MIKVSDLNKMRYIIISVIGPHAGELVEEIFARKIKEIQEVGKCFWLHRSYQAKPGLVQSFCKVAIEEKSVPLCFFIQASSKIGAQETKIVDGAKEFSIDKTHWRKIPEGVLVTGLVKNSCAMIFDKLEVVKEKRTLNLWNYSVFGFPGRSVRITQGGSTICCAKESSGHDSNRMKSNIREILAVGRLVYPFEVWLR